MPAFNAGAATESGIWTGPMIDAHHHFWNPSENLYPWLEPEAKIPFRYGDYAAIKRPYLPADLLADAGHHHIAGSVYVEAEWNPEDPVGETRYVHALAEQGGLPGAMVAQAWLHHPDVADILRRQASFPLVRSVRHKPGGAATPGEAGRTRSLMCDDAWRQGYALLGRHGLHFDLQTPWWHLAEAAGLARDFPDTLLILNHTGLPGDRSESALSGWRSAMGKFAELPNVRVKISGLGIKGRHWRREDQIWVVRETIAMFGAQRAMFGSNFPVDSLCGSYSEIFDGFKEIVAGICSDKEQQSLFHDNARDLYRVAPMDPHPLSL